MKYHLITYGCQMNVADSDEMSQPLKERGLTATSDMQVADIILMNTCTVRGHAEHKALSNLGRLKCWKEKNPDRILIVAGCAASLWGESLKKRYPYVDLVSPATQIEKFPEAIATVLKERWNWQEEMKVAFGDERKSGRAEEENDSFTRSSAPPLSCSPFGSEATAYLTIMRGCNYSCSYCIVPQVRGREKYRPMPEILAEVHRKVSEGYREVMLLGQTVNSYYWRGPAAPTNPINRSTVHDFADLLRAVNAVEGVERIRFMSPHPRHMRDRVIRAMAECDKVARHVHLPVQSGSDSMLHQMKRLYTRGQYLAIVGKLRAAIPGVQITTDIIVGYPGETESDFAETLSLMKDVRFYGVFAFKYSPRPGTGAAQIPDDVPDPVKDDRLQRVLALNLDLNPMKSKASAAL